MNRFIPTHKNPWVFIVSIVFILINALCIAFGFYYLLALPLLLWIVYLAFMSLDTLFLIVIFFVPISIPLQAYLPEMGFNVQIPTDPLLVIILFVVLFKVIFDKNFDRRILLHPISLAIYINLVWMLITCLTSTIPVVSFKFLISRIWFLMTFYFLATQIFKTKPGIRYFFWAFIPLMLVVIAYMIINMSQAGLFNRDAAQLAAYPFFNDHTAIGSTLAMLLPFSIGFAVYRKFGIPLRMLAWGIVIIFIFALILTYCRAAWVSLLVAAVVFFLMMARIKFRIVLVMVCIGVAILYQNRSDIFINIGQNKQGSSMKFDEQIQSISNIQTDMSNKERINRWKSALRMFAERPVFGWGPGTYTFKYASFQMTQDRTPISTNLGDRGNAHSDYIGSLADSGLPGCLSFILILVVTLYTGIKLYTKVNDQPQSRIWVMCAILGLITYYTHAILNNFLDTDKDSALFWGFTAIIVAIDTYQVRGRNEKIRKFESQAS